MISLQPLGRWFRTFICAGRQDLPFASDDSNLKSRCLTSCLYLLSGGRAVDPRIFKVGLTKMHDGAALG
jgi:hypothetical protein